MSILVMAHVFAADMKTATRKSVMLAIADHCDDDGNNSYQAYNTLALKANVSRRTVIRCCAEFVEEGLLSKMGQVACPSGFTVNYSVSLQVLLGQKWGDTLSPLPDQGVTEGALRGDTVSPHISARGDTGAQGVTLTTPRGDTVSPNPSLTLINIYFDEFYEAFPSNRYSTKSKAMVFFEKLSQGDQNLAIEASKVYARIIKKAPPKFINSAQRFLEERLFALPEYQPPKKVLSASAPDEGTAKRKLYDAVLGTGGEGAWVSWFGADKVRIEGEVIRPSTSFVRTKITQDYLPVVEAAGFRVGAVQ